MGFASQPDDHMAQRPIVEIQYPLPDHPPRVNLERVPLLQMIVHHRRQEIMCRGDRMKIPGEMQIDVLHGNHLRVAAAGGAALEAKARP